MLLRLSRDFCLDFTTMPYALCTADYREYSHHSDRCLVEEWSLSLFIIENNNIRQTMATKHDWIRPSVRDKLPYRKLKTFKWKIRGRFVENFLSMWYDEKFQTLITLAETDRHTEPQLIFLNKRNDRGLTKLKIRDGTVSLYGSDGAHDDGSDHQLLIRHKPSRSWLCCMSCFDKQQVSRREREEEEKSRSSSASEDDDMNSVDATPRRRRRRMEREAQGECWIQFKLNREKNTISSSKIIKLPQELRGNKWLCYDEHRDCLIGIKRLRIEELLELGFETKLELIVVPRLTKLLQLYAAHRVVNKPSSAKRSSPSKSSAKKSRRSNQYGTRTRSFSQKSRRSK